MQTHKKTDASRFFYGRKIKKNIAHQDKL